MNTDQRRYCGVLLHPTSLGGRYGIAHTIWPKGWRTSIPLEAKLAKLAKLIGYYGRSGKLAPEEELEHLMAQTEKPNW